MMGTVPLTPDRLRETFKRMSLQTAAGADAWTVAELRLLPEPLLAKLCELLHMVEETGCWPADLCLGLITPPW